MACCEKCWTDAYWRWHCDPEKTQAEHYADLLQERKDDPCTEYEQRHGTWINKLRENPMGEEPSVTGRDEGGTSSPSLPVKQPGLWGQS